MTNTTFPQRTAVFSSVSPTLRAYTGRFLSNDTAEILRVGANGPNLYFSETTSVVPLEVSFDDPAGPWQPIRPGLGWQGLNFSALYFRRAPLPSSPTPGYDESIEFFSGSATFTNYRNITRPQSTRSTVNIYHAIEGLILAENPNRKRLIFRGIDPLTDPNGKVIVGFGETAETAQTNAYLVRQIWEANNDFINQSINLDTSNFSYFNKCSGPGIYQNKNAAPTGNFTPTTNSAFGQNICIIETQGPVYMACYDSALNEYGYPTFANTPAFLSITEEYYT